MQQTFFLLCNYSVDRVNNSKEKSFKSINLYKSVQILLYHDDDKSIIQRTQFFSFVDKWLCHETIQAETTVQWIETLRKFRNENFQEISFLYWLNYLIKSQHEAVIDVYDKYDIILRWSMYS